MLCEPSFLVLIQLYLGHIALVVPDVYKACERMESLGVNVRRKPGPMQGSYVANVLVRAYCTFSSPAHITVIVRCSVHGVAYMLCALCVHPTLSSHYQAL